MAKKQKQTFAQRYEKHKTELAIAEDRYRTALEQAGGSMKKAKARLDTLNEQWAELEHRLKELEKEYEELCAEVDG